MPNNNGNIWLDWLEEEPNILFKALMPKNQTTPFADYYNSQYNQVYGNYLGKLGQMGIAGQSPNLSFYDYMQTYNPMRDFQLLSPGQRGERTPRSLFWNMGF